MKNDKSKSRGNAYKVFLTQEYAEVIASNLEATLGVAMSFGSIGSDAIYVALEELSYKMQSRKILSLRKKVAAFYKTVLFVV